MHKSQQLISKSSSLPRIIPPTENQKKPLNHLHKVKWSITPQCLIEGHEGHPVIYVCIHPKCQHVTRLVCELCFYRSHSKHNKQFLAIDEIKTGTVKKLRYWPFETKYRKIYEFIKKHETYIDSLIRDIRSTFENMMVSVLQAIEKTEEKYLDKISKFYEKETKKQSYVNQLVDSLEESFQFKEIQKTVREIFNKEVRHDIFMKNMENILNNDKIMKKRQKMYSQFQKTDKGKDMEFDKIFFLKKQHIICRHIEEQEKSLKQTFVTIDEAEAGLQHIIIQTMDYLNKHAKRLHGLTFENKHLQDGTDYSGFFSGGNRVLIGMRDYKNGYVYYGEWKNNCRNGWGIYENRQLGYKYAGNWKQDKRNGFGKELTVHAYYEGNFTDDKKEGFGVVKQDGVRYDITWKNDKKHGNGKRIDENGIEKEVYFLNGVQSKVKGGNTTEAGKRDLNFLSKIFTKKNT